MTDDPGHHASRGIAEDRRTSERAHATKLPLQRQALRCSREVVRGLILLLEQAESLFLDRLFACRCEPRSLSRATRGPISCAAPRRQRRAPDRRPGSMAMGPASLPSAVLGWPWSKPSAPEPPPAADEAPALAVTVAAVLVCWALPFLILQLLDSGDRVAAEPAPLERRRSSFSALGRAVIAANRLERRSQRRVQRKAERAVGIHGLTSSPWVRVGWVVMLVLWLVLGYAAQGSVPPVLSVAFSGWTAVVATALGGLPLLLVPPTSIPLRLLGAANALAAGMMIGAGLGMAHGLWEGFQESGALTPLVGACLGAAAVAAAGSAGEAASSSRVFSVIIAFSADAFAEGLAIAAASEGAAGLLVTVALVVHNLPEGLAVAAPLTLREGAQQVPAATACLLAGCTSLPQPLVGVVAHSLLQARIHPLVPCALTAASVGAVLWVAVVDLASEASHVLGWAGALAVMVPTTAVMMAYHELTEL